MAFFGRTHRFSFRNMVAGRLGESQAARSRRRRSLRFEALEHRTLLAADLTVIKQAAAESVIAGTALGYGIAVTNNGPDAATTVSLIDDLPDNATFVSFSQTSGPGFTVVLQPNPGETGNIVATIASLDPGATALFSLVISVNPNVAEGGTVTNAAAVTSDDDPTPENDVAVVNTPVTTLADVLVLKDDVEETAIPGGQIVYAVTVANNGPSDAQNVVLLDTVPTGTTFVSATNVAGQAPTTLTTPNVGEGGDIVATFATLPAGATSSFAIVVQVNGDVPNGTTISNTATAVSQTTADPDGANNSATDTTTVVAPADLAVVKQEQQEPAVAGTTLTYALVIANLGPFVATNVSLTDLIPAGTTFAAASQINGPTFNLALPNVGEGGQFVATIASLGPTESATFALTVNVNSNVAAGSTITNTATAASDTPDPVAENNSSTEETNVVAVADLAVAKTDDSEVSAAGGQIQYLITVANVGPSDAQDVILGDVLPPNSQFVSFQQIDGPEFVIDTTNAGAGTVTATRTSFAASAVANFLLVVSTASSLEGGATVTNTVQVVSTTPDPTSENNTATDTNAIAVAADLVAAKADDPDPVQAGENITYTLLVVNVGPSDAQNVVIVDPVPAGTTFVSFVQTGGPAAAAIITPPAGGTGDVQVVISTLAAGDSATFELVVRVNDDIPDGTVIVNAFVAVSVDTPDPNPENNTGVTTTTVQEVESIIVTGADAGGGPHVRVFNADGTLRFEFFAYDSNFTGGVRVATGDVNGDGTPDIITGAGPGGGPHVRVFDGESGEQLPGPIGSFFAYGMDQTPGVYVASGDFDGDSFADVVTGSVADGGAVKIFSGADGSLLASFAQKGPRIAVGDVTGDGLPDIVAGAGDQLVAPQVDIIDVAQSTVQSFFAYDPTFQGGIYVATGDVDGDGIDDIITGAGAGGGPHVKVFSGADLSLLHSFFAYNPSFTGGARVGSTDADSDGFADIITGAGPGGGPHVRVFSGANGQVLSEFFAYNPNFTGGIFVAGGAQTSGDNGPPPEESSSDIQGPLPASEIPLLPPKPEGQSILASVEALFVELGFSELDPSGDIGSGNDLFEPIDPVLIEAVLVHSK